MIKNNQKEYSKIVGYFLFLIIFSIPNLSFASVECSKVDYTVATINGINTTDKEARDNMGALSKVLGFSWKNEVINYQYFYNPTHGPIVDAFDTSNQMANNPNMSDVQDSDFEQMLTDASAKVTTQKLLLVGHSQGNFYANTFYDTVIDVPGGIPSESIGVYAVATPAQRISGLNNPTDANYTTSDTDNAIDFFSGVLKPNVHINFNPSDDGGLGHSFSNIYLKYEGDKISSDIEAELNNLKSNNVQSENAPCISPPKLTLGQKIQGTVLAITDPVSIPVQTSLVDTVSGTYEVASAIGNGVLKGVSAVASGVSSFAQSIFGTKNLASNVGADVLGATDQSADASQSSASADQTPASDDSSTQNNSTEETPPITIQLPDASQTNITQATPVIVASTQPTTNATSENVTTDTDTTTVPVSPTTPTSYPNLLPGGGGVAADNIVSPTPPPAPPIPPVPDTTPPLITILGDNPANISLGANYSDAGATATDDTDGSVTAIASGTVNIHIPGTYTITYTATDHAGNVATLTRTVNVADVIPAMTVATSDLNGNSIPDSQENDVVINSNTSLPAGEYHFNNLTITNNSQLTLAGDPTVSGAFKGVKIVANNITIDSGSSISADQKGYAQNSGPGTSSDFSLGASYGGLSYDGANYSITYGSAAEPIDLGSGGETHGGGAIRIIVSNIFTDNGIISADGDRSSSGGSIYITAQSMAGNGIVHADGGNIFNSGLFVSPGGGGRVALYYQTSSFNGTVESKGGCGSYDTYTQSCGQDGTAGVFDLSSNDLYLTGSSWQFLQADAPFSFNNIYVSSGAQITSENGAQITAGNIKLDQNSSFTLADNQTINISTIILDGGSTLTLGGDETITANSLTLDGNSTVTVIPEKILSLTIPNITISAGSSISADQKGYGLGAGPGAPSTTYDPNNPSAYFSGATYGGVLPGNSYTLAYGSDIAPVDFGSGGNGTASRGGGAIRIITANTFVNNGTISANGNNTSSGGSIYVTTNSLSGTGSFQANGGGTLCPFTCFAPGGGGRIAIYYQNNSFAGTITSSGGSGNGETNADGTVVDLPSE